jgi:hypothetical protein
VDARAIVTQTVSFTAFAVIRETIREMNKVAIGRVVLTNREHIKASRIVADLEAELGTRLLSRTTRAVVPTEAGGEFLARVEPILAALDEAEHSVREGGELRGLVWMSLPTSFGIRDVIPRLASFAERHQSLHIQLQLGTGGRTSSETPWMSPYDSAALPIRPRR